MICLTLCCCVMTGCEAQTKENHPISAAIIIGNHANAELPNCNSQEMQDLINAVTSSYGVINSIRNDGKPEVAWSVEINKPSSGIAKSKLKQISTMQKEELIKALSRIKAKNPEVDTLAALVIAARSLSSAPRGSEKRVYVLDSGIPTTGFLDYTASNFIEADPIVIANFLSANQELPNLKGVTVTFIGIGDVTYPQQSLSGAQKSNLIETWKAIVEKAGGKAVVLGTLPGNDCASDEYPTVTPVNLPNTDVAALFNNEASAVFSPIEFIGDTAEFVNKKEATKTLEPAARYMKEHPTFSLLLIGTTATGNDSFCKKLSYERVDAVRKLLSSMGALYDRITVVGLGYHDSWHVPDVNAKGQLIESAARQNRKVVLMNLTSPEAKEMIANKTE